MVTRVVWQAIRPEYACPLRIDLARLQLWLLRLSKAAVASVPRCMLLCKLPQRYQPYLQIFKLEEY